MPIATRNGVRTALILVGSMSAINAQAADIRFRDMTIPDQSGKVMTVLGPVKPETLGPTLMHEHLFIEFLQFLSLEKPDRWKETYFPFPNTEEARRHWNEPFKMQNRRLYPFMIQNKDSFRLDSVEDAVNEVTLYRQLGGGAIVDVTPIGLGRNPSKLVEVARQTGAPIVMGTGFYVEGNFPDDVVKIDQVSVDELAYQMVNDVVRGAKGTSIRSGIIGEVGAMKLAFQPTESFAVRTLRAAARASRLTGAAISLHAQPRRPDTWHTALEILEEERADMNRVIVGHANEWGATDIPLLESLMSRGVYVQFDTLGYPFAPTLPLQRPQAPFEAIVTLIAHGHANRLLVSHDAGFKPFLAKNGGWGLTFIHEALVPYLRNQGISDKDIDTILTDNPRRLLTFVEPQSLSSR